MNHFEEIPPNQSLEDLKLQNNIRAIFAEYADESDIYQYYPDDSSEESLDEPCAVVLSGVLRLAEPDTTGVIELFSSIEDGYEEVVITINTMLNIGGQSFPWEEEKYSITSYDPAFDDGLGITLDEDGIAHLRYLVRTADYSKQNQDATVS